MQGLKHHGLRFTRVCSYEDDFNARNKCLTAKLLKRVIGIISLERFFSKFYRRHHELVSTFNVGLKSFLHRGLSEPKFNGDKLKNASL